MRDKVTRLSTNHNLFEEKRKPKRNRAEALLFTSLTPYRWAKPTHVREGNGTVIFKVVGQL